MRGVRGAPALLARAARRPGRGALRGHARHHEPALRPRGVVAHVGVQQRLRVRQLARPQPKARHDRLCGAPRPRGRCGVPPPRARTPALLSSVLLGDRDCKASQPVDQRRDRYASTAAVRAWAWRAGVHALQGAAAGWPRRLCHLPVRPGVVVLGVLAEARPGEIQLLRTRHPANWLWTRNRTRAAFQHRVMPGSARSHAATPWRHQASGTRRVACLHRIPQLLREVHRQAPSVARPALQARGRARVPGAAGGDARSPYWLDEVCRGTSEHATHNRHTPGLRQG